MVSVCLETLSNGNYTKGKEVEIGGVPGNRCIIIKTGSRIFNHTTLPSSNLQAGQIRNLTSVCFTLFGWVVK